MTFLVLPDTVARAGDNAQLSITSRYVAGRIHELCAFGTHFAYSATFMIPPPTAVRELLTCADTFVRERDFRFPAMLSSLRNTKWLLIADNNLNRWFGGTRSALIAAIDAADQVPRELEHDDARDWLEDRVRDDVVPAAKALSKEMQSASHGYRPRLVAQVCAAMTGDAPATPGAWIKLDKDLGNLCALLLADGRVGTRTAEMIAGAIADCTADEEAAEAVRALVARERSPHLVAVVLSGASSVTGVDEFGFVCPRAPWTWVADADRDSDSRLRSFLAPMVDGQQACALITEVSAHDTAHARERALKQAHELRDYLNARYRSSRFELHTTVLVRTPEKIVLREGSAGRGVTDAAPLVSKPIVALREALRYHSEARDRGMPVASIMSAWIALERLGKGARTRQRDRTEGPRQKVGNFLPPRLGSLMGLVAIRSIWTSSWHLAQMAGQASARQEDWRTIEQRVGARGSFADLAAWAAVLTGTGTGRAEQEATELLNSLTETFPPLVQVRLLVARDLLMNGQALIDWSNPVIAMAHAHIDRLMLLRHRAVHEALCDAAGARELRHVGLQTLDAVFQVVPAWLGEPSVGGEPWRALDELHGWRRRLRADWKRHRRPVDSDPERILAR